MENVRCAEEMLMLCKGLCLRAAVAVRALNLLAAEGRKPGQDGGYVGNLGTLGTA